MIKSKNLAPNGGWRQILRHALVYWIAGRVDIAKTYLKDYENYAADAKKYVQEG